MKMQVKYRSFAFFLGCFLLIFVSSLFNLAAASVSESITSSQIIA